MSVWIVKTNELCNHCLYLPAEDVTGEGERATAIELNDLCSNCIGNSKKLSIRGLNSDEMNMGRRVQANSPWIKENGGCV